MALIPTIAAPDDYRRKIAYKLMQEGSSGEPIQHWAQGLAKLAQGAMGGYQMYQADEKDAAAKRDRIAAYLSMAETADAPTPNAPQATPATPSAPPMPTPAKPLPPQSVPMVSADPPPATGPRPGGPVMPTDKVWGDAEAEKEGLYPPAPKNVKMASALAAPDAALPPGAQPAQGYAIPGQPQAVTQAAPRPPVDPRIIKLLRGTPAQQEMGISLMDQQIAQQFKPETTDEIKEYNLAKKQGFGGSFFDFKSGLKKAGAVNVTTNIEKPELAFDTEAGKLQAKRFDELAADGQTAKQMVSDIKTLTDLGKNIGTGKTAEFKAAIGPYAEALGLKIDGLSDIQAYEAIVNRLAPNLRVKGSGAQSDMELKNFLKSLPTLGNTPEGNEIASNVLTGLQENKIRAAEIGSMALTKEISRSQAEKMLRELPDPMGPYREYMKANRGAPTAAGAKPAAPDRAAVEQEMRRRGILK